MTFYHQTALREENISSHRLENDDDLFLPGMCEDLTGLSYPTHPPNNPAIFCLFSWWPHICITSLSNYYNLERSSLGLSQAFFYLHTLLTREMPGWLYTTWEATEKFKRLIVVLRRIFRYHLFSLSWDGEERRLLLLSIPVERRKV